MNNDRELLELAAKAAGFELDWYPRTRCDLVTKRSVGDVVKLDWNPLTDDGDALRLAEELGLLFKYMIDRYELFMRFYCEELGNDLKPLEATRRAIVRAAAEIGKGMK